MNSIVWGLALMLTPSITSAQLKLEPPKEKSVARPPVNVLIQHEWIQLSNKQASILLFGDKLDRPGPEIRKEVETLIAEKKATIVNSSTMLAYSKYTVRTETVLQDIYPTEYDPPESTGSKILPPTPTAFEERPVGLVIEVVANISADRKYIDLDQEPECSVTHEEQPGDGHTRSRFFTVEPQNYEQQEPLCESLAA